MRKLAFAFLPLLTPSALAQCEVARLVSSTPQAGSGFGKVSLDCDTLLVSSSSYDGAVSVLVGNTVEAID